MLKIGKYFGNKYIFKLEILKIERGMVDCNITWEFHGARRYRLSEIMIKEDIEYFNLTYGGK